MPYDLGDPVPLSILVTNEDVVPENAGSVMLTITLPDGTTETHGPVNATAPGVYDHDYLTVQAGRHHVRWVATGTNASALTDTFVVDPPDGGDFIGLTDAVGYLRKRSMQVDAELLRGYVGAACQVITDRMGQVSPLTVVAERRVRLGQIVLPKRPVIGIASVQRLPGLVAIPQADSATGVQGWTLESPEGVLSVSGWSGMVRTTYRAGRSPLPPNFRLAGLELIAHLWRGSQHNQAGGRPPLGATDVISAGAQAFALPFRVMELLGLKKKQERDEPLVG